MASGKVIRFDLAAEKLGVDIAAIKAVAEVESRGSGFLPDGRVIILYERHIMRRRLKAAGINTASLEASVPNLVNEIPGGYGRSIAEWDRLADAAKINKDCAYESCSWGAFQIMGFHWRALGYESIDSFLEAMKSADGQLDAFVRFIKINPSMHAALKLLDWAKFARFYNGPNFSINSYDTKMADAYARHSGNTA